MGPCCPRISAQTSSYLISPLPVELRAHVSTLTRKPLFGCSPAEAFELDRKHEATSNTAYWRSCLRSAACRSPDLPENSPSSQRLAYSVGGARHGRCARTRLLACSTTFRILFSPCFAPAPCGPVLSCCGTNACTFHGYKNNYGPVKSAIWLTAE